MTEAAALPIERTVRAPEATREDAVFTAGRLRIYSAALLAGAIILPALLLARGVWLVDPKGGALPADFLSFWSAGRLAFEGHAAAAYDFVAHGAVEEQAVGSNSVGYFSWFYVPSFLVPMALLASVPYVWAFVIWIIGTLAAYLTVVCAIVPRRVALALAFAWPPAVLNLLDGQTGFATAALLGGGLVLLDMHPIAAGVLFGLLTFKPQFGVLVPIVLAVSGRWRVILSAGLTAALLAVIALALFGLGTWQAFLRSAPVASNLVLEHGATGWGKLQSVYALARWAGAGSVAAWGVHGTVVLAASIFVAWTWWRPVSLELRGAALCAGVFVVTPYVLFYDLAGLSLAIAFVVSHGLKVGFMRGERTLLACLPFLTLPLPWLGVLPLGLAAPIAILGIVGARQLNRPLLLSFS
jgi:hypothetical protein